MYLTALLAHAGDVCSTETVMVRQRNLRRLQEFTSRGAVSPLATVTGGRARMIRCQQARDSGIDVRHNHYREEGLCLGRPQTGQNCPKDNLI